MVPDEALTDHLRYCEVKGNLDECAKISLKLSKIIEIFHLKHRCEYHGGTRRKVR